MNDVALPEYYAFNKDWFSSNIPILDQLFAQMLAEAPRKIIEIGSYEGRSSCYFLDKWPEVELHCIDPWDEKIENDSQTMQDAEAKWERNTAGRAIKHKGRSRDIMPLMLADEAGTFDIVYIDGSHDAPDVLTDAVYAFDALRIGGIMIFDDYAWQLDEKTHDLLRIPKMAIDAFMNIYRHRMRQLIGAPAFQIYAQKVMD